MGLQKLPPAPIRSRALALGTTGLTAYFGTLSVGSVKAGETFVGVGRGRRDRLGAGMIAKVKGCRVIGIAGGRDKCEWLTKEAGFDAAIDYKNEKVGDGARKHCPRAASTCTSTMSAARSSTMRWRASAMARRSRAMRRDFALQRSGGMSGPGPNNYINLILHGARMEGFLVFQFLEAFSGSDRRAERVVRAGQGEKPNRFAARPRERAEDHHPALHRRELRQAIAEGRRPAMTQIHA